MDIHTDRRHDMDAEVEKILNEQADDIRQLSTGQKEKPMFEMINSQDVKEGDRIVLPAFESSPEERVEVLSIVGNIACGEVPKEDWDEDEWDGIREFDLRAFPTYETW